MYFDPYNVELNADPYGMFRRLREEAPCTTTSNTTSTR
ncbi:putative cytochrome P450 [Mycobacterium xenopi 4042]|uniref:Putative cytochrome P450 n=1 Tax=Mycobacterium xenopi 4042 TaxID=1299334 RepID=X8AHU1_MYCXE|nr:putative cytochrome P450 [Mycobacterium xenopi 4042]